MAVYFISESKVKESGYISEGVEAKQIKAAIADVQRDYILPILGTKLYDAIETAIADENVETPYISLLNNYIHPCMLKHIEAELQVFNTFKMANKGTLTKSADNAQPASMNDLITIEEKIRNKAEQRGQTLINHLWANTETYPVFNTETGCDEVKPKRNAYKSGICFGE